ncbi:3-oxoacyl-ACP synthase III family protein [Stigmatella erecta]|uniref:3-oxoacyl-ACP synthase III family protein n=1 Tax=Stigmatella erecta TaxID=83460 RepID=UPI0015A68D5B|nr:3-oxoacyl-[acyl-carrier-protein] synthase III C-terminal domain-containing protein [Stigmatella erecta]
MTSHEVMEKLIHRPKKLDLQRVTGIVERRVCAPHEDSFTLARRAAEDCLKHSSHKAEDLEMLVFCGISRFDAGMMSMRFAPSISARLREALGARNAMVIDVSNACAGMMSGLFVVDDFIRRGVVRTAMVVSGEYISSLATNAQQTLDSPKHLEFASLTVGDAGAAFIAERAPDGSPGILSTVFNTFSEHVDLCTGGPHPTRPGGRMLTRSREIHDAVIKHTPGVMSRALDRAGIQWADLDHIIIHQISVRTIKKCAAHAEAKLGPTQANWVVTSDLFGNTASTTHWLALRQCLAEGRIQKGDRVMLTSQASGLVVAAVVFTIDQLRERYGNAN